MTKITWLVLNVPTAMSGPGKAAWKLGQHRERAREREAYVKPLLMRAGLVL
jgi:hypothetical protein